MGNPMDWLAPIIDIAERNNQPEPEDFVDAEGFLVCGKCKTRRQTEITLPDFDGQSAPVKKLVMTPCECRSKALALERERQRQKDEQQRIEALRRQSLLKGKLAGHTFDCFEVTDENRDNARLIKRYVKNFDKMLEENQGLLFYGDCSTGKTFSAACIANYLVDHGTSVIMTSFVDILALFQKDQFAAEELIDRMNRVKLLIIDDLGAERDTSYALEKVYGIIDARGRSKRPLILTTNLSLDEMLNEQDRRFKRIYERVFELCYPVEFAGESWRQKSASQRYDQMKKLLEGDDGENFN